MALIRLLAGPVLFRWMKLAGLFLALLLACLPSQGAISGVPGLMPGTFGQQMLNSFIFEGDSHTQQDGPAGYGQDYPSYLLDLGPFRFHGPSINGGSGFKSAGEWDTNNIYITNVRTNLPLAAGYQQIHLMMLGYVDVGLNQSFAAISNNLVSVVGKIRADGGKIVALTIMSNWNFGVAQIQVLTNLNSMIVGWTNTGFVDWALDIGKVITNANFTGAGAQLLATTAGAADQVHLTSTNNFLLANWIATNLVALGVPPLSKNWKVNASIQDNVWARNVNSTNLILGRGLAANGFAVPSHGNNVVAYMDPTLTTGIINFLHADDSTQISGQLYFGNNMDIFSSGTWTFRNAFTAIGAGGAWISTIIGGSTVIDFPSVAAQSTVDRVATISGTVADGNVCSIGFPSAVNNPGLVWSAWCSNTVCFVRCANITAGAIDPASATFHVLVYQGSTF